LDFLDPLVERAELLRDQRGLTALHLAALSGHLDAVKRLLPQGKLRPKARAVRRRFCFACFATSCRYLPCSALVCTTLATGPSAARPVFAGTERSVWVLGRHGLIQRTGTGRVLSMLRQGKGKSRLCVCCCGLEQTQRQRREALPPLYTWLPVPARWKRWSYSWYAAPIASRTRGPNA
jgi:ankyrin repeat protein